MTLSIVLIVLGLGLLVGGGECLLRGAVGLATLARLTPAVIGLTVVAAGTSVPELAVSAVAAFQGKVDITVGNVVGSNIFNIAFILGLTALIRPLVITGNTIRLEYPVLAVVTLLCVAVCDHGAIHRMDAVLFLVIYVLFIAYMVRLVREQLSAGESKQLEAEVKSLGARSLGAKSLGAKSLGAKSLGAKSLGAKPNRSPSMLLSMALVVAGIALLTGGAHLTVSGAIEVGRLVGLSERVIGLTIVAAGTGLPEVVTSLVSSIRGRDDVAIGNVIGSNLFNILGILGINGLIAPLTISPDIAHFDNWWMLGVTAVLFPLMFTGMRINRREGIGLLAVYVVYVALLLYR